MTDRIVRARMSEENNVNALTQPVDPPVPVDDLIEVWGICGVNGYEDEVNHTIGINRLARTDELLLQTCTKLNTAKYKKSSRHRLIYNCRFPNLEWFRTLFEKSSKETIRAIRFRTNNDEGRYDHTLLHEICHDFFRKRFEGSTRDLKIDSRVEILRDLMKAGWNESEVNLPSIAPDGTNNTALHLAGITDIALVNVLLDQQYMRLVNVNIRNNWNNTVLNNAIHHDDIQLVERLCELGDRINLDSPDEEGSIPLFTSIYFDEAIFDELLKHRTRYNINRQDNDGDTILHRVVKNNSGYALDKIRKLSGTNLNMGIKDNEGNTALHAAVVSENKLWTVKGLLDYQDKFNINETNDMGDTALHIACRHHHSIVKVLCLSTIDMQIKNNDGRIALLIAAQSGTKEIMEILLQHKDRYDINSVDNMMKTALHLAMHNTYDRIPDIVRLLCEHGINMDLKDSNGNNALVFAVRQYVPAAVQILLEYSDKFDINSQNNEGNSALHMACANDKLDIVQQLCQMPNININLLNNAGETGYAIASRKGYPEICNYLTELSESE